MHGQEFEHCVLINQNQAETYTLLHMSNQTKSYIHFGYLFVHPILD